MPKNFVLCFIGLTLVCTKEQRRQRHWAKQFWSISLWKDFFQKIESKVVGCEGNLDQLLAKARFEEAKLRDLSQSASVPLTQGVCFNQKPTLTTRQQNLGGSRSNMGQRCYNCESLSHLIRQYPYSLKSKHSETPGKINRCWKSQH